MKTIGRYALIAALLFSLACGPAFAQKTLQVMPGAADGYHLQFASATAAATINFSIPPGMTGHQVTYSAPGYSGITFVVKAGVGGSMSTIGTKTTTGADTVSWTGTYTEGQVVISGLTGSGFIDMDYYASTGVAGGSSSSSGTDANVASIGGNVITTTVPVSGTVTVTDGAGALNVIVDSGTVTAVTAITNPVTVTSAQTGSGTATGAIRVELPTNGTGIVGLAAGTNGIGKLTANAGVTIGAVEVAAAQTLATVTTVGTVSLLSNTTALTPGTAATNLGKAEDAAISSGDTGVAVLFQAQATPTATAADNDYILPKTNANGVIWTQGIEVGANAATKPANSEQLGASGVNAEQTAVTNGQLTNLVADLVGKLIVMPYANTENFVQGVTAAITDTTSTSVIASAGGALRNYITHCSISNSHATVGTFVKILDGSTIIDEIFAAAGGGGASLTYPVPLRGTAATAINAQPVTTGANVIVGCNGYKGL